MMIEIRVMVDDRPFLSVPLSDRRDGALSVGAVRESDGTVRVSWVSDKFANQMLLLDKLKVIGGNTHR